MLFMAIVGGVVSYSLLFSGLKGHNLVVVWPDGSGKYAFQAPWGVLLAPFGACELQDASPAKQAAGNLPSASNASGGTTTTYSAGPKGILSSFVTSVKG